MMLNRKSAFLCALAMAGAGCASTYTPDSYSGGYSETKLSTIEWRVRFGGNGYTTRETVQSYWLYHCAELTLAQGYQGFQITTPMTLAMQDNARSKSAGRIIRIVGGPLERPIDPVYRPTFQGEIRMLKAPLKVSPEQHMFDAAALKAQLEGPVTGPKCSGNVCPHIHSYLYSDGTKKPD